MNQQAIWKRCLAIFDNNNVIQAIWKRCLAIFDNNNVIGVHLITLYSFLFYVNDTKVLSFSQTAMDLLNYFPFFFALSLQNNGKMMCEFSRK